ncbi:hypothetical protein PS15m_002768 [Mucor circinelloides]
MNHALIECALRKKKLTCDICHEFGHFQRACPRRNEDSSKSGKKRKVSQGSKKNAVSQPSSTSSSVHAPSPSQANIDKSASDAHAAAATVRAATEAQAVIDVEAAAAATASDTVKAQVAVDARAAAVARGVTDDKATADADKAPVPAHHQNTRSRSAPTPTIIPSIANVIPVCKHYKLPGHKIKTHYVCLINPKNLRKQLHSDDVMSMDQNGFSAARSTDPTSDATADEFDPDSMQD